MTELDTRMRAAVEGLRAQADPPPDVEGPMLSAFHARIGGGGGGGGGGGDALGAEASRQGLSAAIWATKIGGAVVALTAGGLASLWLAATPIRNSREGADSVDAQTHAQLECSADETSRSPTSTGAPTPAGPEVAEPSPSSPGTTDPAQAEPRGRVEHARPPGDGPSAPDGPSAHDGEVGGSAAKSVDVAAELALIRAARGASPDRALRLLDQHAREFPKGALVSEREALTAIASCRIGSASEAASAVARLVALEPGPLLLEQVVAACGDELVPSSEPSSGRPGDGQGAG